MPDIILKNLDLWTAATSENSSAERGSNGNQKAHGIKRLRELILGLAVRGQLVPQDPNDEPIGVLLEGIAGEKARLVMKGMIRSGTPSSPISAKKVPHNIPKSWQWATLADVYYSISPSGKKLKTSEILDEGEFPVVDQGQSFIAGYTNNAELLIELPGPVVVFGDHTTEIKYIDFDFVAGADGTKILRPYKMNERYFYTYLKSYKLEKRGYARHFRTLNANLIALPPLAEQQRIVARVDELSTLCDQLEQQEIHNFRAHQTLVETLLGMLTRAHSTRELTEAWDRVSNHFDTLFTTEHSIEELRETILQLAVRGKLVAQDPEEESASALLKRLGKEEYVPECGQNKEPFLLPKGWTWLKFGGMGEIIGGGTPSKSNPRYWKGPIPWVSPKDMKVDFISDTTDTISEEALKSSAAKLVPPGSLLMVVRGMILAHSFPVAITRVPLTVNQDMKAIVIDGMQRDYVLLMLKAFKNDFVAMVDRSSHGTCKLVSEKVWGKALPIPPLGEQQRIVTKVAELSVLCDTVKKCVADATTTQIHLADAIVEQAVA